MNLEHMRAVETRIKEIQRRFVNPGTIQNRCKPSGLPGAGFSTALSRTLDAKAASCPAYLEPFITEASEKYGVAPEVIKSVMKAESGFRESAVSRSGAIGLMQLMPSTAQALGVDPSDPAQNIDGGTKYLKQQIDRFGSLESALAAYNAGPGSVTRYGGVPPYAETRNYVQEVLGNLSMYAQE